MIAAATEQYEDWMDRNEYNEIIIQEIITENHTTPLDRSGCQALASCVITVRYFGKSSR